MLLYSKMPPKGSPHKKKGKRVPKKAKKQLMSMASDSEDDSQSILTQGTGTLEGHLAGGCDEDGHGGEGEEASQASQAKASRARPTATVTSEATLSEHEDEGLEEGPPTPQEKQCF